MDNAGNFFAAWHNGVSAPDLLSVQGQGYDARGIPTTAQFRLNAYMPAHEWFPAVSAAGSVFVVVWDNYYNSTQIEGRRLDASGAYVGGEFQANTEPYAYDAALAGGDDGRFLVVWHTSNTGSDTSSTSIAGRLYDPAGQPDGGQFQVNSYTTNYQGRPAVARDGAGNFFVVWDSLGSVGSDASNESVQGQRFDAFGTPLGSQFQVNSYTTGAQTSPVVAADAAGNAVVVWQSAGSAASDTDNASIHGQRYNVAGAALGAEFQVNAYTTGLQSAPGVATSQGGSFLVVWGSAGGFGSDTSAGSIQGQRYEANGVPVGTQFQLNTYTTGFQSAPSIAASGNEFAVLWVSNGSPGSDASDSSIQGRRFAMSGPGLCGNGLVVGSFEQCDDGSTANGDGCDSNCNLEPLTVSDTVGAGGTVTTDTLTTGATPSTPIQAIVTSPTGGSIIIARGSHISPVVGFAIIGGAIQIDAPAATPGDPLELTFLVDASLIAVGEDENTLQIMKDGVPVAACTGAPGEASPDPCVSSRTLLPGGDVGIVVLTASASEWQVALPTIQPVTDVIPGRVVVVRPGSLAKFVAKPTTGGAFGLPSIDPTSAGGTLRIFDTANSAGDDTYNLPSGNAWKGLGNPAGSKGFKYKGQGTPSDPCKVVLVKESVIKGICKGTAIALTPPFAGDVGIVLSLGTTDHYCAQFGGDTVKTDTTVEKRKNAAAPEACP
jgi:cysteine-rich repeat protein